MYHRFSPEGQDHPRRLPISEFAWQMTYLSRHHRCWLPDEQLNQDPGRGAPPVVVTVDDGYADFAALGAPVLQQHSLTAIVFVTTGFVSGSTWFWWDRLTWLLENGPTTERVYQFDGRQLTGSTDRATGRWALWHKIADHLSTIDDNRKEAALVELASQAGIEIPTMAPPEYGAMTWDQVRTLMEQGITFGAHTVNHPVLSRVDPLRAAREIEDSRQQLAAETGSVPDWFCYPQGGPGDFQAETVAQVRQAGYRGCYTAFPDPHHNGDPLTLPRYSAPTDRFDFQWLMCGAEYLFTRWQSRPASRKGTS